MQNTVSTVELEELQARLQIQAAIDCYALGIDLRDMKRFLGAWHEDAVLEVNHPPAICDGRSAIAEFIEASWDEVKVLNHFTMNHAVEFDGDTATGVGHAGAMMVSADDVYVTAAATFYDTYEPRDGVWRISRRKVELNHWAEHPQATVALDFGQPAGNDR
jgi:hypothetical protein